MAAERTGHATKNKELIIRMTFLFVSAFSDGGQVQFDVQRDLRSND